MSEAANRRYCLALVVSSMVALVACGRDEPGHPADVDGVSPGRIGDLAAESIGDTSLVLCWTAPGDDGQEGSADQYQIRMSTESFGNFSHFPPAPASIHLPEPADAGTKQVVTVPGLAPATRYFYSLRTADENENWSAASNELAVTTLVTPPPPPPPPPPDTTAPSPVSLSITLVTHSRIEFEWIAPGDDRNTGHATAYDIRYSQVSALTEESWPAATPLEGLPAPLGAGKKQSALIRELPSGTRVWIGLRSIDEAGNQSEISAPLDAVTLDPGHLVVRADGSGDVPTIQQALNESDWGDSILLEPGTYHEAVRFPNSDRILIGRAGAEQTIWDGTGLGRAMITMAGGQSPACIIRGITFANGFAGARDGTDPARGVGAIQIRDGSPTIEACRFFRNTGGFAGAVSLNAYNAIGEAVVRNCTFEENMSLANIGALGCSGRILVTGNLFQRNRSTWDGGAMALGDGSITITGNRFVENVAGDHGGAIEQWAAETTIEWNLFLRNTAYGNDRPEDNGTGGAISLRGTRDATFVRHNTFAYNNGVGEPPSIVSDSTGGVILIDYGLGDRAVTIEDNIFAHTSSGCAIRAYRSSGTGQVNVFADRNLYWDIHPRLFSQVPPDMRVRLEHGMIVADPQFCSPGSDDFRLSPGSPGVIGGMALGAFPQPGCGGARPTLVPYPR